MRASAFSIGAIALNLILGNLCMMPMAMAEGVHEMAEMNHGTMTMASPEDQNDDAEGMPCDGTHCYMHALPTQTSLATDGALDVTLPTTPNVVKYSLNHEVRMLVLAAPPGQFVHRETIVLRN